MCIHTPTHVPAFRGTLLISSAAAGRHSANGLMAVSPLPGLPLAAADLLMIYHSGPLTREGDTGTKDAMAEVCGLPHGIAGRPPVQTHCRFGTLALERVVLGLP